MSKKGVKKLVYDLNVSVEDSRNLLIDLDNCEYSEKWSVKYINELPNSAFAVIEKGYSEGKDKRGRHLPHHNKSVKSASENSSLDLPHFKNSLARVNQIKSVLGTESDSAIRKKAAKHLDKHRSVLKTEKSSFNKVELVLYDECEKVFAEYIKPLLNNNEPMEDK